MSRREYSFYGEHCRIVEETRSGGCKECHYDIDRDRPCTRDMTDVCNRGVIFDRIFHEYDRNITEDDTFSSHY